MITWLLSIHQGQNYVRMSSQEVKSDQRNTPSRSLLPGNVYWRCCFSVTLYGLRELETNTILILTVNCEYDKAASDIDAFSLLIFHEFPGVSIKLHAVFVFGY